jgi:hypothetical protein
MRITMVALGVLGSLPWLVSVARLIMAQDEFNVRLHLVAIAFTRRSSTPPPSRRMFTLHFVKSSGPLKTE